MGKVGSGDCDTCRIVEIFTLPTVGVGKGYTFKVGAPIERRTADGSDRVANRYARKVGALIERRIANASYTIGDDDACKTRAILECSVSNHLGIGVNCVSALVFVGDCNQNCVGICFIANVFDQSIFGIESRITIIERTNANARDAIGNGDTRQRGAPKERRITNARDAIGNGDTRQRGAPAERRIANARDTIGDGDTRQRGAPRECTITNALDAIADGDTLQRVALIERHIANARDAIADGDTRQSGAIRERPIANARDAIADGDTPQRATLIERPIANARDAIADGDTPQRGALIERPIANARDFIAIDGTTNINVGIGTRFNACNRAGFSIIVYLVSKTNTWSKGGIRYCGCCFLSRQKRFVARRQHTNKCNSQRENTQNLFHCSSLFFMYF